MREHHTRYFLILLKCLLALSWAVVAHAEGPCFSNYVGWPLQINFKDTELDKILLPQADFLKSFIRKTSPPTSLPKDPKDFDAKFALTFSDDEKTGKLKQNDYYRTPDSLDAEESSRSPFSQWVQSTSSSSDVFQTTSHAMPVSNGINLGEITSAVFNGALGLVGKSDSKYVPPGFIPSGDTSSDSDLSLLPCATGSASNNFQNYDLHGSYPMTQKWDLFFRGQFLRCQQVDGGTYQNLNILSLGVRFRF